MDCREKTLVYKAMAQIRSPGSCSVGHFEVWSAIQSVILVVEELHNKYMQATGTLKPTDAIHCIVHAVHKYISLSSSHTTPSWE